MKTKRWLLLPALLLLTLLPLRAREPVSVQVNGGPSLPGAIIGDHTYLPLRALSETLGASSLTWDEHTQSASLALQGRSAVLTAGAGQFTLDGQTYPLAAPVRLEEGRLLVPLRSFARPFAFTVDWDSQSRSAALWTDGSPRDELYWLARIIEAESGSEPWEGKLAVGDVILNRVASPCFPGTVHGVIFDRSHGVQFSPTRNGAIHRTPRPEAIAAAAACLEQRQISPHILYFLNPRLSPGSWISRNREFRFTIGGHDFYS